MKNFILHIGLPKTANTTLQKYYFPNFQEPSICFNPYSIIDPLIQAIKLLDFGALTTDDTKLLNNIVESQSNKIPQNNILISLEHLSQRLLKFDFVGRVHFLEAIFPNATIVLVIRYQPVLLRSLYQQIVYQNYLLLPEEVFIPFSKLVFQESENWKASMQINVRDWDYKNAIKYFEQYYGEQFHVLFYENYSKRVQDIGKRILEVAGIHVDNGSLNSTLPHANVSYDSITMRIVLGMAYRKLAFHPNYGFNCRYMQDLMEQSTQARFLFDAKSVEEYIIRRNKQQYVSRNTYSIVDERLLRLIRRFSKVLNRLNSQRYELPEPIKSYLENETKTMNSSLEDVVDRQSIPMQYL